MFKKNLKIFIINLFVFIGLLALAEVAHQVAETKGWFQPLKVTYYNAPDSNLTKEQVQADLGETVFSEIPAKYKYHPPDQLSNFKSSDTFRDYDGDIYNFRARKGHEFNARSRVKNVPGFVFDVQYSFDQYSRRLVENQDKKNADRAVLAFGCSFTFGEGLTQGMDYPSQLAEKMKAWHVYNYGFVGYSTNDILDLTTKFPEDYLAGINQDEAVFAWWFIPDHLTRFFCNWNCYQSSNSWMKTKSEYVLQDGKFIKIGTFEEGFRRRLYNLFSQSAIVKRYGFSRQPQYSESELKTFVLSLDEIVKRTKGKNFLKKYVVIDTPFEDYPLFKKILLEHGFTPIEYFQASPYLSDRKLSLAADGHPSSEKTWLISEVLKNRIEKDFGK